MKCYTYELKLALLLGITFFIEMYPKEPSPIPVINATQFVLSINYRSDVEILGPGDRINIPWYFFEVAGRVQNFAIDGKILSKKDPGTKKYIEVGVPFQLEHQKTNDSLFIMAPPDNTNLIMKRFIQ